MRRRLKLPRFSWRLAWSQACIGNSCHGRLQLVEVATHAQGSFPLATSLWKGKRVVLTRPPYISRLC